MNFTNVARGRPADLEQGPPRKWIGNRWSGRVARNGRDYPASSVICFSATQGKIFCRRMANIMSPETLSFPIMNAIWLASLPVAMATKSS